MPTLYLHIGTPKTGTTAIQRFCEENDEALRRRGYVYPIFPYRFRGIGYRRNAHFLVGQFFNEEGALDPEEAQRVWNEAMDEVTALFGEYPNVILSDEGIWHSVARRYPDMWERLKREADARGFEVQIVVYLRRQDEFLSSWWNQQIKEGENKGVNRWSVMTWQEIQEQNNMVLDYYGHLEKIAAVFGRERVTVRIYERSRFADGSILSDFLGAVGLKMGEDFRQPESDANTGLTPNFLEIKRIINELPDRDPAETKRLAGTLRTLSAMPADASESFSMFSPEEAEAYLEQFRDSNAAVARDYLGEEGVPLFRDPLGTGRKWTPDNPYMYRDMTRFFGAMCLAQQAAIRGLDKDLKAEKRSGETMKKKLADQEKKLADQKKALADQGKKLAKLESRINRISDAGKHPWKAVKYILKKKKGTVQDPEAGK